MRMQIFGSSAGAACSVCIRHSYLKASHTHSCCIYILVCNHRCQSPFACGSVCVWGVCVCVCDTSSFRPHTLIAAEYIQGCTLCMERLLHGWQLTTATRCSVYLLYYLLYWYKSKNTDTCEILTRASANTAAS